MNKKHLPVLLKNYQNPDDYVVTPRSKVGSTMNYDYVKAYGDKLAEKYGFQ